VKRRGRTQGEMKMAMRKIAIGAALACVALAFGAATASASGPLYDVKASWGDTSLTPGSEGQFTVQVRNIGTVASKEPFTIADQLPAGVTVTKMTWEISPFGNLGGVLCSGVGTGTATCTFPIGSFVPNIAPAPGNEFGGFATVPIPSGYLPQLFIDVAVSSSASGVGTNKATFSGASSPSTVSDEDEVHFGATPAAFGLVPGSYEADAFDAEYPVDARSRQAGDHPFEQRVNLDFNQRTGISDEDGTRFITSNGLIKDVDVTLPRGLIGNPEALPKCDPATFAEVGTSGDSTACPSDTQVGYLRVWFKSGPRNNGRGAFALNALSRVAIYNLEPPKGQAADFGFNAGGYVQGHIYGNVDPAQNYAIKTLTPNISSAVTVTGTEVTFWGVPADPAHDKFRFYPTVQPGNIAIGAPWGSAPIRPFFTNPMDCGFDNGGARIRVDSYNHPDQFTPVQEDSHPLNVSGCEDERFRFKPQIAMQPTSKAAGGPTGLDVNLQTPLRNDEVEEANQLYAANGDVKGIATPPLKKAVVTLPAGMTASPSAAQGLVSCTPEEIGLGTSDPVRCPDASQFGTLTLHTPLLPIDEQPEGFVYVAKQNDNPFHNFLTLYLVIEDPERGILVKLPGRVDLDPQTGQITTTFDDLPQLPSSDVELSIKGGLRAGLVNPQTCGTKTIAADLYTWQDPQTPHRVSDSYDITQNPDGTPCHQNLSERPFDPQLSGGTVNNLAGAYSPMELTLTRSDEDQELSVVEGTAPPGLLASLKGVGRCSDAAIAAAANPDRTGTEEVNSPSCPADSLVGTVDAGAGVGQVLTYVHGKIYLAGPYKGAPVSGVAIVPAIAGPFDVGTIVTRAPGYVNPKTAELHLVTDPLPQIFKGIPVRVRDIRVHLNRSHFTLNPTNCEPFSLTGMLFSTEGKSKLGGSPFQAADCASLGFQPKLQTKLFGGTHRGAHPKFRGVFKAREGDANVKSAVVTLPRSEFLDQSHIRTVCTRVQFAANACPAGSIYGHAVAKTPLLDEELQGPVYLRSSDHKLPDLVADLHGIVDVEVVGRVDSIRGGIRASFEQIPDAPVETFTITMQGGKKGLLVNSRNICAHDYRLNAEFKGQNGKEATLTPQMAASCKAQRKAKKR
jgi:uncharacterized repeat protein (TIGR01451 family)